MTKIKILATGSDFLKGDTDSTSLAIEELVVNTQNELQIMAYLISKHADKFMTIVKEALECGIKTTLIINQLEGQDQKIRKELFSWQKKFPYFKLVDFNRYGKILHAKVLISDREKAVIGSANFSLGGLSKNYEIGMLIQGKEVWELSKIIDDIAYSKN